MLKAESIDLHADSVLDLLIAQCTDLEALLMLARREAQIAEANNFDDILRVVDERATLGERLEVYHRQIAEMRLKLGEAAEPVIETEVARRSAALVSEILAEDARTHQLLLAARSELGREQQRLNLSQRCLNAYLRGGVNAAVAYDHHL